MPCLRSTRSTLSHWTFAVCLAVLIAGCSEESNFTAADEELTAENRPIGPLHVPQPGDQGCTPGFWKNNPGAWEATGLSPSQLLNSLEGEFPEGVHRTGFRSLNRYGLQTATLMDALRFGGGPGALGAARILLRHAVAAVVNAAHPDIQFPDGVGEIIVDTNRALRSGDRGEMLALKDKFELFNELGCPLSADESAGGR